ncbi:MAG: DUF1553 domain-containing protein [Acidobacteria bacterium]|nr:DUF1553 domain-containing protein [Acidobacteriota bacterium]
MSRYPVFFILASCAWAAPQTPSFEKDVAPILAVHCVRCHGADARQGGLDLRTPDLIRRGSSNGPVLAKTSTESTLYRKIASGSMPPPAEPGLKPPQVETLRQWIDAGAPSARTYGTMSQDEQGTVTAQDRGFWAFRKLSRQTLNSPDAFLLAKLRESGLGFSPPADRVTLARRAWFDLLGLPPSPEQVDSFLADRADGAFERLVDKLLESPHFGERWGRHWLDVAGYADVYGIDSNTRDIRTGEGKWRYRDYVVRAYNQDKPYDRFLVEQIAGDEMVNWRDAKKFTPEMVEHLEATGFLRTAADDTNNDALNGALIRYRVLYLTVQNMTNSVLGLTVSCAQCHTHKYDPIPQRDYYSLLSLFTPSYNPQSWLQTKDRWLADVSPSEKAEIDRHNLALEEQAKPLEKRIAALRHPAEEELRAKKAESLPAQMRVDLLAAMKTPAAQQTPVEQYLVRKFGRGVTPTVQEIDGQLAEADRATIARLDAEVREIRTRRRSYGKLQALYEVAPPFPTFLNRRGNHETPGAEVEPGFLTVLSEPGATPAFATVNGSSGRRLAFAKWLVEPDSRASALVARVMVNRIWQHLFGAGIVDPPDNFGKVGARPSHPELLDWLAGEFIRGGWRVKPLIKKLMLSDAYQQASRRDDASAAEAADPGNRLLWRMRLRRLESEAIRDSVLAASGMLSPRVGGEPVAMDYQSDGRVLISEKNLKSPDDRWRRSLYLFTRRSYNLNMLSVFDSPLMDANCPQRTNSAVVLQSLTMLNDGFLIDQSEALAARVLKAPAAALDARIKLAFRLTIGREPTAEELRDSAAAIGRLVDRYRTAGAASSEAELKGFAAFCHSLLNTNAFLYIG